MLKDKETAELISKISILDSMGLLNMKEEDLFFGGKVLSKKLEAFDIPYKVDIGVIMIMDVLVESNPGGIQVLFIDTVKKIPKEQRNHITIPSVLTAFGSAYPKMDYVEKLWDAQKYTNEHGHYVNSVDKQQYWFDEFGIPYTVS